VDRNAGTGAKSTSTMHDPHESGNWDEFQWERALRDSDKYAVRYLQLLKRFSELPGGPELIARELESEFEADFDDLGLDQPDTDVEEDWDLDSPEPWEWNSWPDEMDDSDSEPGLESFEDAGLFCDSDPVFVQLRQTALGWCNIYAAILPQELRPKGLKVLFYIGRTLANYAYGLCGTPDPRPAAAVAFCKRAHNRLDDAIGLIRQMATEKPRLEQLLDAVCKHLLQAREGILSRLADCRQQTNGKP